MQLGSNLLFGFNLFVCLKNTKNSNSSTRNKKYRDSIMINIIYDLFHIKPDLFENLILYNLILYTSTQNKKKSIPQKKFYTKSIQIRLKELAKDKKKKFQKLILASKFVLFVIVVNFCFSHLY